MDTQPSSLPSPPGESSESLVPYWRPPLVVRWTLTVLLGGLLVMYLGIQRLPLDPRLPQPSPVSTRSASGVPSVHLVLTKPLTLGTAQPGELLPRVWGVASSDSQRTAPSLLTPVVVQSWVFGPFPSPQVAIQFAQAVRTGPNPLQGGWPEMSRTASAQSWVNGKGFPAVTTIVSLPLGLPPGRYVLADVAQSQANEEFTVQAMQFTLVGVA